MIRHTFIPCLFCLVACPAFAADDSAQLANRFSVDVAPFLQKHCLECHGEKEPKADLSLAKDLDAKSLVMRRSVWESVLDMVETGQMPPKEQPKPDPVAVDKFVSLVKALFDDADRHAKPDPGRVTVRRLNRVEYNNTIRDLIGIDFNPAEDFPSDDIGHGFDNIGDVLTLSPVLMERYLSAAETIMNRAIVPNPPKPSDRGMGSRYLEPAGQGVPEKKWRGISTRSNPNTVFTGPLHTRYMVPDDGEYNFRLNCYAEVTADVPVQLAILVSGQVVLGQLATDSKSNEITAIPRLLAMLTLTGRTVTIDAMGCQREIARQIIEQKGHYILAVKENQPTLHAKVKELLDEAILEKFAGMRHGFDEQRCETNNHGRIETRRVRVTNEVKWLTPLGRVGTPSDIAKVASFLASDDAGWLTGEIILASGGLR